MHFFTDITKAKLHEAHFNLTDGTVPRNIRLGDGVHAPNDPEEVLAIEKLVLQNPEVQKALAKLELPKQTEIVCDPWIYGSVYPALFMSI